MTEKIRKPLIAITMGDPAGVGPEIILKALATGALPKKNRYLVIGDRGVLEKTARRLGVECPLITVSSIAEAPKPGRGFSLVRGLPVAGRPGQTRATRRALGEGRPGLYPAGGPVGAGETGPGRGDLPDQQGSDPADRPRILPATPNSWPRWPGHERFGMMLAGKRLKVSLVTIHCSMRETLRRLKPAGDSGDHRTDPARP